MRRCKAALVDFLPGRWYNRAQKNTGSDAETGGLHDIRRKTSVPQKRTELDPGTACRSDRDLPAVPLQMGAGRCHSRYRACDAAEPALRRIHRHPAAGRRPFPALRRPGCRLPPPLGTHRRRPGLLPGSHRPADPRDLCFHLPGGLYRGSHGQGVGTGLFRALRLPDDK